MNFIRKYIGIGWFILILITSAFFTLTVLKEGGGFFLALSIFIVCSVSAMFGIMIINYAKPDTIMTTGGFFNLLWAKLVWHFIAPAFSMFFTMYIGAMIFGDIIRPSPSEQAQQNFTKYCSTEQIAKTGMKKCEAVKKEYMKVLKTDLSPLKQNLQAVKTKVKSLTKDKENKCSEKGLQEYGSAGCDTATSALNENEKTITNLSAEIENIENKLKELKTNK